MKTSGILETARQNDHGYWSIKVDDKWYGTYKDDHSDKIGQEIQFEATEKESNGRTYWNANKGKATGNRPAAGRAAPASPAAEERQASIVLQSSYKTAAQLLGALIEADKVGLGTKKNAWFDNAFNLLDEAALRIYRNCSDPLPFVKEETELSEEDKAAPPEDDFDPATA